VETLLSIQILIGKTFLSFKLNPLISLLYLDSSIFNLTPFKSLINLKDFLRSLNGESGRALHLVYKFDKQIARCNDSHIKILHLFEFPLVLN